MRRGNCRRIVPIPFIAGAVFLVGYWAERKRIMRKSLLRGAVVAVVFGAGPAFAMGGSGNLSPSESPYALIAPQTLGVPVQATEPAPVARPEPVKRRRLRPQ